jgi:hypothetical protein
MHPAEWQPYINSCFQAQVSPEFGTRPSGGQGSRIMQIIGDAPASAGTHLADGSYSSGGKSYDYGAAIDIRTTDLNREQTISLWKALIKNGFAAWWRHTGSFKNNQHIHAVYLGVPMKKQLRSQAHSFFDRRSGLIGNSKDYFLQDESNFSNKIEQNSRILFLSHNRMTGDTIDNTTEYWLDLPEVCDCVTDPDEEGVYGEVEEPDEVLQ